jgi:hypothetical protein
MECKLKRHLFEMTSQSAAANDDRSMARTSPLQLSA